jgi:hypothetical protein
MPRHGPSDKVSLKCSPLNSAPSKEIIHEKDNVSQDRFGTLPGGASSAAFWKKFVIHDALRTFLECFTRVLRNPIEVFAR